MTMRDAKDRNEMSPGNLSNPGAEKTSGKVDPDPNFASINPYHVNQAARLYVRPEYDRAYPGYLGDHKAVTRPAKEQMNRSNARLLMYLLVASLLTCGGVVIGAVLAFGYLQQALPQMYPLFPPTAEATPTPYVPAIPTVPRRIDTLHMSDTSDTSGTRTEPSMIVDRPRTPGAVDSMLECLPAMRQGLLLRESAQPIRKAPTSQVGSWSR